MNSQTRNIKTPVSLLKIVILHEDHITGIEAAAVLRRLAAGLESEFGIRCDDWQIDSGVWKFEMLHDPELWEQATAEAVEADMIIISVGSDELPVCIEKWIESVLPRKAGGPAALVALLGREHEISDEAPRLGNCLRQLAEKSGLDFFCNTDRPLCTGLGLESIICRSERSGEIRKSLSTTLKRL